MTNTIILLWKNKFKILFINVIIAVSAIVYVTLISEVFESRAVLAPKLNSDSSQGLGSILGSEFGLASSGDEIKHIEAIMQSENILIKLIQSENLMTDFFQDDWDSLKSTWKTDPAPTIEDALKITRNQLRAFYDGSQAVFRISYRHSSPEKATSILNTYIRLVQEKVYSNNKKFFLDRISFYSETLKEYNDPILVSKMQKLIIQDIGQIAIQGNGLFQIIDEPRIIEKRVFPKKGSIVIGVTFSGFWLACILIVFSSWINRTFRKNEPSHE